MWSRADEWVDVHTNPEAVSEVGASLEQVRERAGELGRRPAFLFLAVAAPRLAQARSCLGTGY